MPRFRPPSLSAENQQDAEAVLGADLGNWALATGIALNCFIYGSLSQQREEPETAEWERGREHPRAQMGESAFSTPPSPWAES